MSMSVFESRFGIAEADLRRILDSALSRGGDFADLFLEHRLSTSLLIEDDIVKETSESVVLGLGVRVWSGERTGYGYTNDLSPERTRAAALAAAAIANHGGATASAADGFTVLSPLAGLYGLERPSHEAGLKVKIGLVREAYDSALARDPSIRKVRAGLQDLVQHVTIADSEGRLISDTRPLLRLTCTAIAEKGTVREIGFAGGGGRIGLSVFDSFPPRSIGEEAADEALRLLGAGSAPAGEMPVVLAPGHAGVLIHEAVGHLLEADFHRKKTSIFWNKMGAVVGSSLVTIFDDPTIPLSRGSYAVDDEGTVPEKTLLIESGRVRGLLTDRLSARILRRPLTGHGRRQGYSDIPIPRMSNTYIAAGPHEPEEIVRSVKKGLYAERFTGGQVEDSGKFTFSVSSGRLIEDGRLTSPVKQATLIGTNIDILRNIVMAGTDLMFGPPTGSCGKDGQHVPVNDGCPTLKIASMTVGGSE